MAAAGALPDHRVVALAGRDALAFLQAQAMNDIAALADGQWQWNGWLTPKGRTVALFAALRLDAETAWLLVADADAAALADALRRFVFRSKVAISVRDDLAVAGAFAAPAMAAGAALARLADGRVELDMGGDGGPRTLWIASRGDADAGSGATAATSGDAAGSAFTQAWRAADLAHGWPRLAPAQQERFTPQQLSLDRLRAFSVKKGCYPGQEIVARTHFLGQAKRGLLLLRGDGDGVAVTAGDALAHDGHAIGEVVAVAGDAMLAVATLDQGDAGGLAIGGQPVTRVALHDGLAR